MADQPIPALSQADLTAILTAITALNNQLSFLKPVPKDAKRKAQNMGNNAVNYVEKGVLNSQNHLGKLSRDFDEKAYQSTYALLKQSTEIRSKLQVLTTKLDSNLEAWGADLMVSTNKVYKSLQEAAKEDDALKPSVAEMGEFYKRRNRKDKPAAVQVATKASDKG